jgi:hypothetical protein
MADPEIREQLETLYWWGVPTFFRAPHDEDPANCDIGVLGIPHSSGNGSTERDQHLGPRAVRGVSSHNRRPHRTYGINAFEAVRVSDLGDVALPEAMDNEACIDRIAACARAAADAGTRLVSIGGDHAITGGVLLGLAGPGSQVTGGEPVALIHFDAHVDSLRSALTDQASIEYRARKVAEDITLALQGSRLLRHGHPAVTEAFLATRMAGNWGGAFGTLPTGLDLAPIIERAMVKA